MLFCKLLYNGAVFLTKISYKASVSLNSDYLSHNYAVLSKEVAKAAYLLLIGW